MRRSPTFHCGALAAACMTALCLIPSTAAAASPKAGLYTGTVAKTVYNGFTAPVSFTVSRNGKQLRAFTWASGGCTGIGGPGNAWASSYLNYRVGTINISRTGTFSVKNVKSTNKQGRVVKVTSSTVSGRFRTATTVTGTISYAQKITKTCHGKATFTAALGPAPRGFRKLAPKNGSTITTSGVTLSWGSSRNATGYQYCLARSQSDSCNGRWANAHRNTRVTIKAVTSGTTYYWQVKASSVHGTVAADNGDWSTFTTPSPAVKPHAGAWRSTALTGASSGGLQVTSIAFAVAPDQARILGFTFDWTYSMPGKPPTYSCSGSASSSESIPTAISHGEFSTPSVTGPWTGNSSGSGTFHGVFDSPTTAHGTAQFGAFISGSGCYFSQTINTGTFSWTAAPQP